MYKLVKSMFCFHLVYKASDNYLCYFIKRKIIIRGVSI